MMDDLTGKLVKLRPVRDEDFEYFASLRNDLRTQAWNQRMPPCFTAKKIKERFEKITEKKDAGLWSIEAKDGKLIGYLNYEEGPQRLAATVGIATGMEAWGKDYAREAVELVLEFLFVERGLQVVRLWTNSWNVRAVGLAKKLGFRDSIRLREEVVMGGKLYDALMMDMLREEYYESRSLKEGAAVNQNR